MTTCQFPQWRIQALYRELNLEMRCDESPGGSNRCGFYQPQVIEDRFIERFLTPARACTTLSVTSSLSSLIS